MNDPELRNEFEKYEREKKLLNNTLESKKNNFILQIKLGLGDQIKKELNNYKKIEPTFLGRVKNFFKRLFRII